MAKKNRNSLKALKTLDFSVNIPKFCLVVKKTEKKSKMWKEVLKKVR